jgi:pimeloyl-ACP methyl ester carboxylesterase
MSIKKYYSFLLMLIAINVNAQPKIPFVIKAEGISATQSLYGNNPKAGKFAQTKDAKIYYETYGKGQPIVLLHGGIMGSMDEMTPFIENLKDYYQVIVIGTRGHGKSEIGKLPITMEVKANDIMTVINEVSTEKATIIGFSDGAYTGYMVASMFPNRVNKLVAIGAGEQIPGLRSVVFSGELFDLKNDFWKKKLAIMPEPERIEAFWGSMANMYNNITVSKELFNTIKCPVLLMSGENDRNAPLATVINAYHMIPKSQLSVIPNAGHVVFIENFPAVWASIVPFLNQ